LPIARELFALLEQLVDERFEALVARAFGVESPQGGGHVPGLRVAPMARQAAALRYEKRAPDEVAREAFAVAGDADRPRDLVRGENVVAAIEQQCHAVGVRLDQVAKRHGRLGAGCDRAGRLRRSGEVEEIGGFRVVEAQGRGDRGESER